MRSLAPAARPAGWADLSGVATFIEDWANQNLGVVFVRVEPFEYASPEMEDNVTNLDYEVDEVVIEVNNLEDAEQMGRDGGNDFYRQPQVETGLEVQRTDCKADY